MRIFSAITTLLLACAALAVDDGSHAGVVESLSVETASGSLVEGRLDWTGGTLTVTGEAVAPEGVTNPVQQRLMGFRAAKVVALRALLEVLGGVRVDGRTKVSMAMVASDSIRARVEGLVRGARVVPGSRREEDGLYRLDLQIDLLGELADAVLADSAEGPVLPPTRLPEADSVIVFVPDRPYTGLVVDARGTRLRPSMSPRIVDDQGQVIYAASHVDRAYAVRTGVVGYERDLQRALVNDRVGGRNAHPYVVDVVDVAGLYGSDAVIRQIDGMRLHLADLQDDFLSQCRVVFVIGDKPVAAPAVVFSDAATVDSTGAAVQRDFLDSTLDARARDAGPGPAQP